jgi:hypothetical protein
VSVTSSGTGDAHIESVRGPLVVTDTGRGDIAIAEVESPQAECVLHGSGDLVLGSGRIARLRAVTDGSGDLTGGVEIGDGELIAAGSGDIRVARVSGALRRRASGSGDILVGQATAAAGTGAGTAEGKATARSGPDYTSDVLTAAFVLAVAVAVWRTVRRHGGLAAPGGWFAPRRPAPPGDAAVIALCETLARLERRVGLVEGYVTSREFELQKSFRELNPGREA